MSSSKPISNLETGNKRKKRDDTTAKILSKSFKLDKSDIKKNKREINLKEKKMAKLEDEDSLENNALPKVPDNDPGKNEEAENVEMEESKNQISFEFYFDSGYAHQKSNNQEIYAKNENNEDYYFTNPTTNLPVYAKKKQIINNNEQEIEYPKILNDGEVDYIYKDGFPVYPQNITTQEPIFPVDNTGEEIYLEDSNGNISYPINNKSREFYRKDKNKKEIPIDHKYAKDEFKNEIYPKESNGDEYYLRRDNREIGAYTVNTDGYPYQYYARKANGDEFYPRNYVV